MDRRITPDLIKADIAAMDEEIKRLQSERGILVGMLGMMGGRENNETGRKKRKIKGGKKAYRETIYNALNSVPVTTQRLHEITGVSNTALLRYLREMEGEGLVRETTGNARMNFKWVRAEVKIRLGEPLQPAL